MFVSLRTHSEFSIKSSLLRVEDLVAHAKENASMIALTDVGNFFAVAKFYKAAVAKGVKPILGLVLSCVFGEVKGDITLLAKNEAGYRRLLRLSTSYQQAKYHRKDLSLETLFSDSDIGFDNDDLGSVWLLLGADNPIANLMLQDQKKAQKVLGSLLEQPQISLAFGISRIGKNQEARGKEEAYFQSALALGDALKIPSTALQPAFFKKEEDFEAHEARVCINASVELSDPKREHLYSKSQWLKNEEEMKALFKDYPELLDNSEIIAKSCNVKLRFDETFLPDFKTPDEESVDDYFARLCQKSLSKHLLSIEKEQHQLYQARLLEECQTIKDMGYAGYYLIVMDFIKWAKEHGVPVGPGRGSGAGSLAAFCLSITEVDPIPFGLLFERFLNPERVSLPDFDVDFCVLGRDRVIDYVKKRYGETHVAQIVTHGTMKAKMVVRDAARVLGRPYILGDKLAKAIGDELGVSLSQAQEQSIELQRLLSTDEEALEIFELSLKLEGLVRNVGTHAGGVVIAPKSLTHYTALCVDDEGKLSTQLDMKDLESIGLVKFDFLGLAAVTIIQKTIESVLNSKLQREPTPKEIQVFDAEIPLTDKATYETLCSAETVAIFQLESSGMRELIKNLKPDVLSDIVALVALFRPGPLGSGMVDDFVKRKHGQAEVPSLHESVDFLLEETYGVIVYQEQVMKIAQLMAGYTLGGADLLRRAMGKKLTSVMAEEKVRFKEGAKKRGISEKLASEVFDLIEKFADYGFNKSHSVAYALLAYKTAYLKTHYPTHFLSASCNIVHHEQEKLYPLIFDAKRMGIQVLPPDVRVCLSPFSVGEQQLIYGFSGLRGVGLKLGEALVLSRNQKGTPKHFPGFCLQAMEAGAGKLALQSLIHSGALDHLHPSRNVMLDRLLDVMNESSKRIEAQKQGQGSLFSTTSNSELSDSELSLLMKSSSHVEFQDERLQMEKQALGFYLSAHPISLNRKLLSHFSIGSLETVFSSQAPSSSNIKAARKGLLVAAYLQSIRKKRSKNGNVIWIAHFEDEFGLLETVLDQKLYEKSSDLFSTSSSSLLLLEGNLKFDEFREKNTLKVQKINSFSNFLKHRFEKAILSWDESILSSKEMKKFLKRHQKEDGVALEIHLLSQNQQGKMQSFWQMPPSISVIPDARFLEDAKEKLQASAKLLEKS